MIKRLFAKLYDFGMQRKERRCLGPIRQILLSSLTGKILELGSGTGVNFSYYSVDSVITALEPSRYMIEASQKRIGNKTITLLEETLESAKQKKLIQEGSYDHIVCTLVLCSVPDVKQMIDELLVMLKSGGTFIVIEHVLASTPSARWWQRLLTPMQSYLADGCCLDRPTDELLRQSGLVCLEESYLGSKKIWYWGVYQKM